MQLHVSLFPYWFFFCLTAYQLCFFLFSLSSSWHHFVCFFFLLSVQTSVISILLLNYVMHCFINVSYCLNTVILFYQLSCLHVSTSEYNIMEHNKKVSVIVCSFVLKGINARRKEEEWVRMTSPLDWLWFRSQKYARAIETGGICSVRHLQCFLFISNNANK